MIETIESCRKTHDPDDIADLLALLGEVRLDCEKSADAEDPLRECLSIREKQTPDRWERFHAQALLGSSLLGQQKGQSAEPLLLQGKRA